MNVTLISHRLYGQPKITRPKEIKGAEEFFSGYIRQKAKSSCYLSGNVVYIKCRDLFSLEMSFPEPIDASLPLSALAKKYPERFGGRNISNRFVYPDAWCRIIARNEGYIKIEGLVEAVKAEYMSLCFQTPTIMQIADYIVSQMLDFECNGGYATHTCDYGAGLHRFILDMCYKLKQMK